MLYTVTKSGTYDVAVIFGAHGLHGSPFRIAAQPSRRDLLASFPSGRGLSLTTAGTIAAFTITVKDTFGNWQPDPSVVQSGLKIDMEEERGIDFDGEPVISVPYVEQLQYRTQDIPAFVDALSLAGESQVATPTDLDNPRLVLRYVVTQSGKYEMSVAGYAGITPERVHGSPFDVIAEPNVACATTSLASGAGLSTFTAGILASLTILSRDEYSNSRSKGNGDGFTVRVRQHHGASSDNAPCSAFPCESWNTYNTVEDTVGGRDFVGTLVRADEGRYSFSFNATRAGINYVWATLAGIGGLQATYYSNSTDFAAVGNHREVVLDETVDFSVGGIGNGTRLAGAQSFSARWSGLVRSGSEGEYTFYLGSSSNQTGQERVKLWVDNFLIINQWDSLADWVPRWNETGISGSTPFGTIHAKDNTFMEVLLAVKGSQWGNRAGSNQIRLGWRSHDGQQDAIPSHRLYRNDHVHGSPFAIRVSPTMICAGTSRVYGDGLSLATAGVLASFRVQVSWRSFSQAPVLPLRRGHCGVTTEFAGKGRLRQRQKRRHAGGLGDASRFCSGCKRNTSCRQHRPQ